jgi:hypothetical protein
MALQRAEQLERSIAEIEALAVANTQPFGQRDSSSNTY